MFTTNQHFRRNYGVTPFGAEYDFFERPEGYDKLRSTYNMDFRKIRDMDIGLKYIVQHQGEIDVMNVCTTDDQLALGKKRSCKMTSICFPPMNAVCSQR